jgi:hypothetical protein
MNRLIQLPELSAFILLPSAFAFLLLRRAASILYNQVLHLRRPMLLCENG